MILIGKMMEFICCSMALDDYATYFDPYYRKGDPNITDGDEPFYQKRMQILFRLQEVAQRTIHMYLCGSAKEKVTSNGFIL